MAINYNQIHIIKYLEKTKININIINNYGENAYLLAAYHGYFDLIIHLEKIGLDMYITNNDNKNAWQLTNNKTIKKYLETRGFSSINGNIDIELSYGFKINKYIKTYDNEIYDESCDQSNESNKCIICYSKLKINEKYLICNFNHLIHKSCYKIYCIMKNKIDCECIMCSQLYI
jgi:hypothetical protein